VIAALFDGFDLYIGRFVGDLLPGLDRTVGLLGVTTTALPGTVGALCNVAPAGAAMAGLNNVLLPLWLVALGLVLAGVRVPRVLARASAAE
jgi:hypothetical protein